MLKKIFLFKLIIIFMTVNICLATEEKEKMELKDVELMPLTTLEGRLSWQSLNGESLLILTTPEGKHYALKGQLVEERLKPLENLDKKKVALAGIPSQIHEKTVEIQVYQDDVGKAESRQVKGWEYTDFLVFYIDKIEDVEEEAVVSLKKETEYKGPLLPLSETSVTPIFHRIRGKIITANIRKPVPNIEIQDLSGKRQDNAIIFVPGDTIVLKATKGEVVHVRPTAIRKGDTVDLWFESQGDRNSARIITILE